MIEMWFAFMAGLAGSFHCIGMCGGVVAALSVAQNGAPFRSRFRSHLFYNAGRVVTYTLLGAAAGLAGQSLDLMALKAASYWFLVLANAIVIMVGFSTALGLDALNLSTLEGKGARLLTAPLKRTLASRSCLASLPLGMILGLLPCGLVYAPLIAAAGTGSITAGASTMASMGAGTVPVMLAFGTASSAISARLRSVMLRLAGLALLLMGAAGLWRTLGR